VFSAALSRGADDVGHRYLELVAQALDDAGSSQLDVTGASVEMITSSAALRRSSSSIARSAALGSPTVPVAAMPSAAAQVSASSRHVCACANSRSISDAM